MTGLNVFDLIVILIYFILITYIGLRSSRKVSDTGDFFMGGRKFGKLLMIAKAFGVGTRADQAVAVTGAAYEIGLSGIWYQWLYVFSTPFYWIISPIYRRLRFLTTGDFFEERYGQAAGSAYTIAALLFFSVTIGMVLHGIGTTVEAVTQGYISSNLTIIATTMVFVTYSVAGGLVAAVSTKVIQSILLLILSFLLIPFAMAKIGGFAGLHQKLAPQMFSLVANKEVTFFFITMITINALIGVVAMPHHMAIGGAGKSEMNCRIGWTYGNITKRFVTIAWAFVGLSAAALFPGLESNVREQAFGMMIVNLLPNGLIGLIIAAMIASVMALCDTYMIDGAALFTRNIYKKYVRKFEEEKHYLGVARWSSIFVVILGIFIAFLLPNIIAGFKVIWSIMAFMGIPFWMALFWRRGNRYGFWLSVFVTSALYFFTSSLGWTYPAQIALYLPGGVLCFIMASLFTKPEPEEKINSFYMLLETPVGEEYKLHAAGVKIIHEGASENKSTLGKPDSTNQLRSLEERGQRLLIVDLLQLYKNFSFRRYRIDILGFLLAWGIVFFIILFAFMVSQIGS